MYISAAKSGVANLVLLFNGILIDQNQTGKLFVQPLRKQIENICKISWQTLANSTGYIGAWLYLR